MRATIEAVSAYVTLGEIMDFFRKVFGSYMEPAVFSYGFGTAEEPRRPFADALQVCYLTVPFGLPFARLARKPSRSSDSPFSNHASTETSESTSVV